MSSHRRQTILICALMALSVALPLAGTASAEWVGFFDNITDNSGWADELATQFQVGVSEVVPGQVRFEFINWFSGGPAWMPDPVITDIYWRDDPASILFIPPVEKPSNWNYLANPGDPPGIGGGGQWAQFSADSNEPVVANGIWPGPGNSGVFVFNLAEGITFQTLIDRLTSPFPTTQLALHVQNVGLIGGNSESFISQGWEDVGPQDPGPLVPVPSAAMIGFLGFAFVGLLHRQTAKL